MKFSGNGAGNGFWTGSALYAFLSGDVRLMSIPVMCISPLLFPLHYGCAESQQYLQQLDSICVMVILGRLDAFLLFLTGERVETYEVAPAVH